jgi:hypothetical protein
MVILANKEEREEDCELKTPTLISAYACKCHAASCVVPSCGASIGWEDCEPMRILSCCELAGMPVTGSSRALSCVIVHAGLMRRSDDEFSEVISRGTSVAEAMVGLSMRRCMSGVVRSSSSTTR